MKKTTLPENIGGILEKMKETLPAEAVNANPPSIEKLAMAEVDFHELKNEILVKYGDTDVSGLNETEIVAGLREIKKARTTIEGKRKTTASVLAQVSKAMNQRAKELIQPIELVEERWLARKVEIELAKEAEAEKKRREEAQFFNARTQRLFDAGFVFNGAQYVAGLVAISTPEIMALDDLGFDAVVGEGQVQAKRLREFLEAAAKSPMETELEGRAVPGTEAVMEGEPGEGVQLGGGLPPVYSARPSMPERPLDMGFIESFGNFGPAKEEAVMGGNPPEAEAVWVDQDSPAAYRPEGYLLGFEACRASILNILETAPPMKRPELMEKIRQLSS